MSEIHDPGSEPERRFVVLVASFRVGLSVCRRGDVVTEAMLGGDAAELVGVGAVREADYDLASLFDDQEDAPME